MLLPFLTLGDSAPFVIAGMIIFGIVMGTHEAIMGSAIADIAPFNKRGTSFGIFNTGYGLALFIGATLMGLLYDLNLTFVIIAGSFVIELAALGCFVWMVRSLKATVEPEEEA